MSDQPDEPILLWIDTLLKHASENAASDIHIEPFADHYRIRQRYDGLLFQTERLSLDHALRVVTLLKVLARLNIAEKRLPQDGRFSHLGMDIRISTCPMLFGEKIVLRLLNVKCSLAWEDLGFTAAEQMLLQDTLSKPQGLVLVTGPTGSGKTRTLYAALHHLNTTEKNIITIEDPVELQLPGINQVNVQPKIGLGFAELLRTILRQDPDILMIGEIRDTETATIAIQAAHTGHLVLATLHTQHALESIQRLIGLKVSSEYLASTVSLILAQRLLRKLCDYCKTATSSHGTIIYQAHGCPQCLQGYKKRIAIYEFLSVDENTILTNNNQQSKSKLWQAGLQKVMRGETSLAEVERVLGKNGGRQCS